MCIRDRVTAHLMAPVLTPWLLPVALPMIAAPILISWTSRRAPAAMFRVPEDGAAPPVRSRHDGVLAEWAEPGGTLHAA